MFRAVVRCVPICVCSSSLGSVRSDEKEEGWLDGLLEGEKRGNPKAPI